MSNDSASVQEAFMEVVYLAPETFELFKSNLPVLLVVPALLTVVPYVVGGPIVLGAFGACIATHQAFPPVLIPLAIMGFLGVLVACAAINTGFFRTLLHMCDGRGTSFSDLFNSWSWFPNYCLCSLLVLLAIIVGFCFFIVPGIFIAIRLAFAPILVIDENLGPVEACARSNELVGGYSWQVFAYMLGATIASSILPLVFGVIPVVGGFIGGLANLPIVGFNAALLVRLYRQRNPLDDEDED